MNLMDAVRSTAAKQPDHPAVVGPGKDDVLTYRALIERIDALAAPLQNAGIGKGSTVGLHVASGRDYIILNYALWNVGACVVPVPVELMGEEKQRICREIALSAVVTKTDNLASFDEFKAGEPAKLLENVVVRALKSPRTHPPEFAAINCAFLRFTSGTTGAAKGVVLSHETIFDRISAANEGLQIGPADRVIWLQSMSYHFAVTIVAYLTFGATIVLSKDNFGPTVTDTLFRHQGTIIYGSPVHYELMGHDNSAREIPSLRLAISTATSLRAETADLFYKRYKVPLTQAYGIIEIGLPCMNLTAQLEKRGAVGKVLPAYELKLDDIGLKDNQRVIKLRGKGLLDAYYDPWQARAELMKDGWFSTGDLGMVDEDGYLYILGRANEMINVDGARFFPQEVEAVLETHPKVKEACVFAYTDRKLGERARAHVVPRDPQFPPTEDGLKRYCADRLAPFKIPESIRFVPALNRTASGKLIRQGSQLEAKAEGA